jgi:hypothetical protein
VQEKNMTGTVYFRTLCWGLLASSVSESTLFAFHCCINIVYFLFMWTYIFTHCNCPVVGKNVVSMYDSHLLIKMCCSQPERFYLRALTFISHVPSRIQLICSASDPRRKNRSKCFLYSCRRQG